MKCPKCDTTVYRDGSVTVDCPDCGWVAQIHEPDPAPRPERPALQTGVLEGNPHLLNPGAVPAEFAPWRDRLAELRRHPRRHLPNAFLVSARRRHGAQLDQQLGGVLQDLPRKVLGAVGHASLRERILAEITLLREAPPEVRREAP